MERLTGKGAQSLNEAYSKVYASVLTEESINNTAEQWVAACIEEGINFEEYTVDEITEAFIADCDQPEILNEYLGICLLYTSPSPRDKRQSRMPSSA